MHLESLFMKGLSTDLKVKKAIILAGGEVTKIPPLNDFCPWMLPVFNKPLIGHTIDFLKRNGFETVIITLPEDRQIPDFLRKLNTSGMDIILHREDRPRGTAGILKDVERFIDNEPFLVISSKLFPGDIDLASFIKFNAESGSPATIGVYRDARGGLGENVLIRDDMVVKGFHRVHPSLNNRGQWMPSGINLFDPTVLEFIDKHSYMDMTEQFIPALQREGINVFACEIEGFHRYLDNMGDYVSLHRELLLNSCHRYYTEGKEEILDRVFVGKNSKVSPQAYLLGPIVIGDNCNVEDWAQIIGPAVVGDGCLIARGSFIRESILWDGITLSSGSKVEYSVIGDSFKSPDNFTVSDSIVLNGERVGANPVSWSKNGKDLEPDVATGSNRVYQAAKRIMDASLAALGIVLTSPLLLLIAAAIKMDSEGPVFYRQKRCGIHWKLFDMIKFRTMVTDAEKTHKDLLSQKDTDGPMFKMVNDPRVTRVGALLRKTSLDELPQLLNVLRGEMSLVGPRPLIMEEMRFSTIWQHTRLMVKPGITGLWQIQGRAEASFHDWIRYDVQYVKNRSLWLDIKILLKTIPVVLKKVGAY